MSATNYAKNQSLDLQFGGSSYTPPANYYMGLSTTTISSSGSNATEPVGASYARVQIPNDKSHFTYASSGCLVNSGSIAFPTSSGSWGTITNIFLSDASTSGSIWFYTVLGSPKIVQDNTLVSWSASAIAFYQT